MNRQAPGSSGESAEGPAGTLGEAGAGVGEERETRGGFEGNALAESGGKLHYGVGSLLRCFLRDGPGKGLVLALQGPAGVELQGASASEGESRAD